MPLPLSPRLALPTLPIIGGVLALIGWTWDIDFLKRGISSSVAMNPATAVGFILLALEALRLYAITNVSLINRFCWLATLIVIIASAMKLSDLALDTSFHIDQRLFSSKLTVEAVQPSRMAPNTAFCFFALGWAMLFLRKQSDFSIRIAQMLAVIPAFIALMAIIGYSYGVKSLYGIGIFIPMAINTAVSFLFIAGALIFAYPDKGCARILTATGYSGLNIPILLSAVVFVPFLLGWLSFAGERAGFYDMTFAFALLVILNIAVLFLLTYLSVRGLLLSNERKQKAETELRDSEERYRLLVENSPMCIYEVDMNGRFTSINRAGVLMVDVKDESVALGHPCLDMVNASDRKDVEALLAKGYAGTASCFEHKGSGLSERIFKSCFVPIKNSAGVVKKLMGMTEDITERKRMENALRIANVELQENVARTQLLLDSALDGIISMDHNGKVTGWNSQAEKIFGYSDEQALGREMAELIVPSVYRESHRQGLSRFMATGASTIIGKRLEITGLRADASEFPIELTVSALEQNGDYSFSAYVRDITGRKQAEAEQQEVMGRLHKIACQLPCVVFQFCLRADGSSYLPYASEVLRDIYRIDPEEVRDDAAKLFTFVHPDDLGRHKASIQASARDLSPWRDEYRLRFADGTERWLFGNALPQREDDGSVLWHGFVTDITERKMIEDALRESENKLATILDTVEAFIYIKDCNYQYQYANQPARQVLGKSLEDIIGKLDDAFFDEATTVKLRENDRRVLELGERIAAENTYVHKYNAVTRTYFTVKQPLRREDGSIYGLCGISTDITERKKVEEVARAAAQYARSLIEASLDPLVTISAEGKITDVNIATEHVTGVDRNKLIGSDFADYFTDPDKAREGYQQVFSKGFVFDYPLAIRHASGKVTDVLYNASVYYDDNGKVLGVFAAARDVTERKRADRVLNQLKAMIDTSLDGFWIVDLMGNILQVNEAYAKISGYSIDELMSMQIGQLEALEKPEQIKTHIEKTVELGYDLFETRHRHKDGHAIDIEISVAFLPEFQQLCAFCRDITARKRMEDELKASEEKFRSIIEVSPVPMVLNDQLLNITFLNPVFVQTFGYNLDDIPTLADWWTKAYPDPGYRQWVAGAWQAALAQAAREHQSFTPMELNICCKDGGLKTVLATAAAISESFKHENLVVLYDITERKQAELVKRNSEEQLRAFYELDLVGLTITSPEKGWLRINDCLCKMLEYSEQALRQMTWAQLTHPDDLAADVEQFDRLLANEINGYALEKRFISRTGKIIPVKLVVRGVHKAGGELDYVTAMVEDITEYKQAEAELKRSNAELEQFAYAVSHDMRQPLRMVTSYLSLIENALAGSLNEETQQFLDFAVNGARRMDAMILSLLDYSRVGRKTEAKTRISSKASLDEALAFLNPELGACGGEIEVTGDWPELFASRDELTRLLQNLIGNALKYHEENRAPRVHIHGTICNASLRVEVRDQGIGIEPSQMYRLFKVFSRLQARSRFDGAGIGLALCRKIVEHHGGAIGVESAGEGQGCLFWFELPLETSISL